MALPVRSLASHLAEELRAGRPLRSLVVGAAGTGKTSVLDAVADTARTLGHEVVRSWSAVSSPVPDSLLLLDDAHLVDEPTLALLQSLLSDGAAFSRGIVITRRPTTGAGPALARLTERLAATGDVTRLGPLDDDELSAGTSITLGAPADAELLRALAVWSGGDPTVVRLLLRGWQADGSIERGRLVGDPHLPDSVVQLLSARVAQLSPKARTLLATLCILDGQPAGALGSAGSTSIGEGTSPWAELTELAFVTSDRRVQPVATRAVTQLFDPSELGTADAAAARALQGTGADPIVIAELWRRSGIGGAGARAAYLAAVASCRATDPWQALGWLESVLDPDGGLVGELAALQELCGNSDTAQEQTELALRLSVTDPVANAVVTMQSSRSRNWARVADRTDRVVGHPRLPDDIWRGQKVLALVAAGDVAAARAAHRSQAPARASALTEVGADVTELIMTSLEPSMVGRVVAQMPSATRSLGTSTSWVEAPALPHEWLAAMALAMGDVRTASQVLGRLGDATPVGPAAERADALRQWIDVRLGNPARPDDAAELSDTEEITGFALRTAAARRSGDVRSGGEITRQVARTLGSLVIDPLNLDPALELFVAAQRFGPGILAEELGARIRAVVDSLGSPLWKVRFHWAELEGALATREIGRTAAPVEALQAAAAEIPAARPLARAGLVWCDVAAGHPETAAVEAAVEELTDVDLSWEAAQLAGQAAIRTENAAAAKQLLGRARSLRGTPSDGERTVTPSGLSEREVEVAQLVLEGRTQKDIGSMLFISPKTVEHHVAHIRSKLGTTSRAEFLAAMREDLASRLDET